MMRGAKTSGVLLSACLAILAGCITPAPAVVAGIPPSTTANPATLPPPAPTTEAPRGLFDPTATATPGGSAIIAFTAMPGEAAPGEPITLRWQTTGAFGAEIVKVLPNQT